METYMMNHVHTLLELAEDKGYTFIHPFDDLDVATGQGSVAMEIMKETSIS